MCILSLWSTECELYCVCCYSIPVPSAVAEASERRDGDSVFVCEHTGKPPITDQGVESRGPTVNCTIMDLYGCVF